MQNQKIKKIYLAITFLANDFVCFVFTNRSVANEENSYEVKSCQLSQRFIQEN